MDKFLIVQCEKKQKVMVKHIEEVFHDTIQEVFTEEDEDDIVFVLRYDDDTTLFSKIALVGAKNVTIGTMN